MAKHRLHGEGTVYKSKSDGRWHCGLSINGKQKILTFGKTDADKELAFAGLDELRKQKKEMAEMKPQAEPFGYHVAKYIAGLKIKESTRKGYNSYFTIHISPRLGHIPVNEITTDLLQKFMEHLQEIKLAPKTIRSIFTAMGPLEQLKGIKLPPNKPRQKKNLFTDEQVQTFLAVVDRTENVWQDILYVYWEACSRISEIIGLKWENIGKDFIDIQSALTDGGKIDDTPKTEASRRKIYMSADAMRRINRQPRISEYVFTKNDKPISDRSWRHQWYVWLYDAFGGEIKRYYYNEKCVSRKVPNLKITPHSLRHMQATDLICDGWEVADVQIRGGWASTRMLNEIYAAHSTEKRQRKMVKSATKFRNKK